MTSQRFAAARGSNLRRSASRRIVTAATTGDGSRLLDADEGDIRDRIDKPTDQRQGQNRLRTADQDGTFPAINIQPSITLVAQKTSVRSWPIAHLAAAQQSRRFGSKADTSRGQCTADRKVWAIQSHKFDRRITASDPAIFFWAPGERSRVARRCCSAWQLHYRNPVLGGLHHQYCRI
jgi:hypothetical protein